MREGNYECPIIVSRGVGLEAPGHATKAYIKKIEKYFRIRLLFVFEYIIFGSE
jgi:hypothetical protein